MGDRLGIIAGSGEFPLIAAALARRAGYDCVIAAIRGEADPGVGERSDSLEWFEAGDLAGILGYLKTRGVGSLLLAGKISQQAAFREGPPDAPASAILAAAGSRSPVRMIEALIGFLGTQGIRILDPTPFLKDLFCPPGILTATRPSPAVLEDAAFGFGIARKLADLDIGQTVVVKGRAVVAIEGIEGTDKAIARGGELAGPGTTAVKVVRSSQDPRIDLPAVGPGTVLSLVRSRGSALCFEAGRVAFFRREEAVDLADKNGIAVLSMEDPDAASGQRRQS
ncbi:MAG: LpxI family protein [Candidatus Aminicenantales bacterium]